MTTGTVALSITRSALIDRLRKLNGDLADENRHDDAMMVDFAIQAIGSPHFDFAQTKIEQIQRVICEKFCVSFNDLRSKRRTKRLITPRHIGMGLARLLTECSLPEIAEEFGKADHTTALYAIRKTQSLINEVARHVPDNAPISEFVALAYELAITDEHLSRPEAA